MHPFPDFLCDVLDYKGERAEFCLYSDLSSDTEISGDDFWQGFPGISDRDCAGCLFEFLSGRLFAGQAGRACLAVYAVTCGCACFGVPVGYCLERRPAPLS